MTTASNNVQSKNPDKFVLVWLDSLVKLSQDNIDTTAVLKKLVSRLLTFDHKENCAKYIQSLPDETFVLIVSGRLGQEIIPYIHELPQLIAIYVYCSDKKRNQIWAKNFIKVNLNLIIRTITK